MEWWGPSNSLEFIDKPDALTIRTTSIRRTGDLIWPAGSLLAAFATYCFGTFAGWPLSLIATAAILLARWFNTRVVELRVTPRELLSRSSRYWTNHVIKLRWTEVQALVYRVGGKNRARGLYAKKSFWSVSCLIPDLDRDETQRVIEACARKFPDIVLTDGTAVLR